jgi:hypothetical protein
MQRTICVLLAIAAAGWTGQPKSARPEFKDYLVERAYSGAAVAPKIPQKWRMFRTRIREGAKSKVEFAGHYTVPRWGCGAGCSTFVIVDSITGTVYDGLTFSEPPVEWVTKQKNYERMEFQPKSRLIKINGCPDEENCGFYDYEMIEGKGLKLVRKELLAKEFQP